jgi:tetratricopeptide (TPR) repeat protein
MNKTPTTKPIISDAFDLDAAEGFASVPGSSAYYQRKQLKNESISKNNWKWILLGCGLASFILFGILTTFSKNTTTDNVAEENRSEKHSESSPIVSDALNNASKLPEHLLVRSKTIASNFTKQKTTATAGDNTEFDINSLPLLKVTPIENEKTIENSKRVIRKIGSEIYAYDLKLLDYTKYRDASAFRISNKEIELSGTPANKYNAQSDSFKDEYVEITYSELIDQATLAFRKENYKRALALYTVILEVYPTDVNALFYSAICYRNYGNYGKSVELLENLLLNKFSNFDEETLWYLAENLSRMNNTAAAKVYYTLIVSNRGFYAEQAKLKLKKMN